MDSRTTTGSGAYFNPRSPCGERHEQDSLFDTKYSISIHAPHAGSDCIITARVNGGRDFNPRSPCGERHGKKINRDFGNDFNPRSPCGERLNAIKQKGTLEISIHAPHAGSDPEGIHQISGIQHFNPRSPCGERLWFLPFLRIQSEFQSTLPMRGATQSLRAYFLEIAISIHAPHAGSDAANLSALTAPAYFNPRSPCGERLGPVL